MNIKKRFNRIQTHVMRLWTYVSSDVWHDSRRGWRTTTVKTLNLSVRSFFNSDVQTQACAMTYRTLLAIVPAMALLFAIGRGFGFQVILEDSLYKNFPAQHEFISQSLKFVDSYLSQSSEGIFVGVGLVFLLWTLISLLSSVEDVFNMIWGIKTGRSIWRKITDYTAMLLILPVLMICASGMSMLVSSTLNSIFHFSFLTPLVSWMLEGGQYVMTWLFFTAAYILIPNTKVKFKNAFFSGIFAGTGFIILQWLFVSGQMYVSKYNAIYGSFSFLPLLLIWMQLAWVITMAGMVICFSSQNIFQYAYTNEISDISPAYYEKVAVAAAAVTVIKFSKSQPPVTLKEFTRGYELPAKLISDIMGKLESVGLVNRVIISDKKEEYGYQPALPIDQITIGMIRQRLRNMGRHNFVPHFAHNFPGVVKNFEVLEKIIGPTSDHILVKDIDIHAPKQKIQNK